MEQSTVKSSNLATLLDVNNMIGKTLGGRYKIISYLGGGGYGQTYLAEDEHLPNKPPCVVKQLKPQATDSFNLETANRLFNTEAEVLYKLGNHNQIPRLFAHFEDNKEFYLVQEFIEGVELSQEIAENQHLQEAKVISILQEILEVLNFVHQQRVIHRDINPRNIIRRKQDNKLVLIDFGAVKQVSTQVFCPPLHGGKTVAIGTVGYMPSEQVNGNPGFYSDIYAVGMIAMQALTGLDPSCNQLPRAPQTGEIAWRNRVAVSPGLSRIIDRMLRYNFRDRYQTVGEVLKELHNLQSTTTIAHTINLQAPIHKNSPSSNASAEINILPRSNQGRSVKPLQIGAIIAVVGAIFILFKLISSSKTTNQSSPTYSVANTKLTSNAANFLAQGNQLRDLGQYEKALIAYDQALAIKPDYLEASWSRCYTLNQMQRYEEALIACDKVLKNNPNYYQSWWSKGYALDELKRYEEALTAYEQALKINPNFLEAWSNRGATLNHLQRYEEALAAYEQAVKINPNFPEAWNNRGATLNRLQRYQEALTSYEKALKIKPNYPEAWNNRGVVLANLRRFKDAIASYDKAIQLKPDYKPAIENRQRLLQVIGQ